MGRHLKNYKGEYKNGSGFVLVDNGNKYTTPLKRLQLLDELNTTDGEKEKLNVYILYEWSNLLYIKWQTLLENTFGCKGFIWRRPYKKQKDMMCIYFEDNTVSRIRCSEKSEWTWKQLVELINDLRVPIIDDEWYGELNLDIHFR